MGFEETVLSEKQLKERLGNDIIVGPQAKESLLFQAEITWKAGMKYGIWLFAWWKDGEQYVGTSGKTLKEAYKELGID